jgi:Bacterial Ig-like domain (group 1)
MSRRRAGLAVPAAVGLAIAMSASAFAYGPQVPQTITVTPSQGTFICEHPTALSATVLDQDGLPIKGLTVTWSFTTSPSSGDRFLQQTSKTNPDGVARTNVKLDPVAGDRVITATADGVSGSATVHGCQPRKPQGAVLGITSATLPETTTGAGSVAGDGTVPGSPVSLIAIGVILLLGVAIFLRRAFSHR